MSLLKIESKMLKRNSSSNLTCSKFESPKSQICMNSSGVQCCQILAIVEHNSKSNQWY